MKRSILIAGLMVASAVATYGQGQVVFGNYYGSSSPAIGILGGVSDSGGAMVGAPILGATNPGLGDTYSAELAYFIGSTGSSSSLTLLTSSLTVFDFVGGGTANGDPGSGWFSGGTVTVPGVTAGTAGTLTYQVRIFKGGNDVMNSPLFTGTTTGTTADPTPAFPQGAWQSEFALVPEPTTFALTGLGAAALLIFRRRK